MTTENTNTETTERAHAKRSMSRWCAMLECACFESKPATEATNKGTAVHDKLAGWLTEYKKTGALPAKPESLDFVEAGAYRAAQIIVERLNAEHLTKDALMIEERVQIEGTDVYGYVDVMWQSDTFLTVLDFKTFYNPSRDYTAQLAGYAYAYATQHGLPDNMNVKLIVAYGDNPTMPTLITTIKWCKETYSVAMAAFDKRDAGEAQPQQCAWCDLCVHATTCPAAQAIVKHITTEPKYNEALTAWADLPVVKKAQLLVLAETVVKWADAVRENAKADLLAGLVIEDEENGIKYGLRTTKGRKTPRTEDCCRMLKAQGVTDDELRAVLKIGATEAKTLLKEHGIKGKEADALIDNVCDFSAPSSVMVRQ